MIVININLTKNLYSSLFHTKKPFFTEIIRQKPISDFKTVYETLHNNLPFHARKVLV